MKNMHLFQRALFELLSRTNISLPNKVSDALDFSLILSKQDETIESAVKNYQSFRQSSNNCTEVCFASFLSGAQLVFRALK